MACVAMLLTVQQVSSIFRNALITITLPIYEVVGSKIDLLSQEWMVDRAWEGQIVHTLYKRNEQQQSMWPYLVTITFKKVNQIAKFII